MVVVTAVPVVVVAAEVVDADAEEERTRRLGASVAVSVVASSAAAAAGDGGGGVVVVVVVVVVVPAATVAPSPGPVAKRCRKWAAIPAIGSTRWTKMGAIWPLRSSSLATISLTRRATSRNASASLGMTDTRACRSGSSQWPVSAHA